ncbi:MULTISPECIES: tRNA-uridine aminocarboxypropyltransferase [Shewanella]|uniref:tRNA-uridine aminocarboxypropyltransferase n=1 Tax=Shewanella TaxID=22 RepID=UPI003013623E
MLLTHERELLRPTNTGRLALDAFPHFCSRLIWSRVAPDKRLVSLLSQQSAAVLFPDEKGASESPNGVDTLNAKSESLLTKDIYLECLPQTLVIIDATWQEARKMLRQSPYLKQAAKFALSGNHDSSFTLRRNQVDGGLCTIECIIEVCKIQGLTQEAEQLNTVFELFQQKSR